MKIQIILIKLFVIGALFIISNQNLHLGIQAEREIFFDAYLGWVKDMANSIIHLTGNVAKSEWLPKQYL